MTPDEQLDEWLKGNPIHNDDRDECCPDFSCCRGIMAPDATRKCFAKAFKDGDDETVNQMLLMFLGGLLDHENTGEEVYLAGDIPPPPIKLN